MDSTVSGRARKSTEGSRSSRDSKPHSSPIVVARPWSRPLRGPRELPAGLPRPTPRPALFYGLPPSLVAEWCSVSLAHARALCAGVRKPSRQVQKLVTLFRDERALCGPFKDWKVRADKLVDPHGAEFTENLLRQHELICQFSRSMARDHGEDAYREFWKILGAA